MIDHLTSLSIAMRNQTLIDDDDCNQLISIKTEVWMSFLKTQQLYKSIDLQCVDIVLVFFVLRLTIK